MGTYPAALERLKNPIYVFRVYPATFVLNANDGIVTIDGSLHDNGSAHPILDRIRNQVREYLVNTKPVPRTLNGRFKLQQYLGSGFLGSESAGYIRSQTVKIHLFSIEIKGTGTNPCNIQKPVDQGGETGQLATRFFDDITGL